MIKKSDFMFSWEEFLEMIKNEENKYLKEWKLKPQNINTDYFVQITFPLNSKFVKPEYIEELKKLYVFVGEWDNVLVKFIKFDGERYERLLIELK